MTSVLSNIVNWDFVAQNLDGKGADRADQEAAEARTPEPISLSLRTPHPGSIPESMGAGEAKRPLAVRIGAGALRGLLALLLFLLVLLLILRAQAAWREGEAQAPANITYFDTPAGQVAARVTGSADGVPVVLVHGTAAWSGFWSEVADHLAGRGWRVVAIDLPPFGWSGRDPEARYDRTTQAERLSAVLAAFGKARRGRGPQLRGRGGDRAGACAIRSIAGPRAGRCGAWRARPAVRSAGRERDARRPGRTACHRRDGDQSLRARAVPAVDDRAQGAWRTAGSRCSASRWCATARRQLMPPGCPIFSQSRTRRSAEAPPTCGQSKPPVALVWGDADTVTPLDQGRRLAGTDPRQIADCPARRRAHPAHRGSRAFRRPSTKLWPAFRRRENEAQDAACWRLRNRRRGRRNDRRPGAARCGAGGREGLRQRPSATFSAPRRDGRRRSPEPRWEQKGGSVNDASCLSRTAVAGIVSPRSEREVQQALAYAKATGLTISPAGVRHSMGGHAFRRGGIMLDMRRMNAHPARSRALDRDGRRGRELARHPERHPPALRGEGDAVDRHLHGRRVDLGQCSRDGPSGGRDPGFDPVAARDARRRPDRNRLARSRIRSSSTSSSAATACSGSSFRPSSMSCRTPSTAPSVS